MRPLLQAGRGGTSAAAGHAGGDRGKRPAFRRRAATGEGDARTDPHPQAAARVEACLPPPGDGVYSGSMDVQVPTPGRTTIAHQCSLGDEEALADWCDLHLAGDYFFKRRHLANLLRRPHAAVFALLIDGVMGGLLVIYRQTTLHNLYLAPEFRTGGLGSAIVQRFRPAVVRAKTNMLAGDPTAFYEQAGYVTDHPDPAKPHITVMRREDMPPLPAPAHPSPPPTDMDPDTAHPLDAKEARRQKGRERAKRYREQRRTAKQAARVGSPTVLVAPQVSAPHELPPEPSVLQFEVQKPEPVVSECQDNSWLVGLAD